MDEEKRLLRIEKYIDGLKNHLLRTNQLLHELAADIANIKCETPETNPICQRITQEIKSLKTLRQLTNIQH